VSFSTPHDTATGGATALGTQLMLNASSYVVTNIVISNTNPGAAGDSQIDVSHLGQTTGELAARMTPPLVVPAEDGGSGRQITFDYIGKVVIADGSTGTYKISVAGANLVGGFTGSYYTVQSSTLTLATNDAIRGQGVITVAR
jgi:hypothetical protein